MKLTPWFPETIKPVRPGVYQTTSVCALEVFYSYWGGRAWGWPSFTPHSAFVYKNYVSPIQARRWRGLAEEPK